MASRKYKMSVSATRYVRGKLPETLRYHSEHKSAELATKAATRIIGMWTSNAQRATTRDKKERRLRINYMTVNPK